MNNELPPKKPLVKDAEYMRKAYLYTGVALLIALIGSAILAHRIIDAEQREAQRTEAVEEERP